MLFLQDYSVLGDTFMCPSFFYFIGNCSKTVGQRRFDNINLSARIACRDTRLFYGEIKLC